MTPAHALLLGILQGATEFLPVSSSAHLALLPWLLVWEVDPQAAFVFDVLVQWGTLLAVLVYFRKDLFGLVRAAGAALLRRRPFESAPSRLFWFLGAATLPAAVAGLIFKSAVQAAFGNPSSMGLFLIGTAALLLVGERWGRRERGLDTLRLTDALWIGLLQAVALLPGISRSGATITGGLLRHLRRQDAARFSFLMSIPALLGAGVVALADLSSLPLASEQLLPVLIGVLTAAAVGYLAIHGLLSFLARHALTPFAFYCLTAGLFTLLVSIFRG